MNKFVCVVCKHTRTEHDGPEKWSSCYACYYSGDGRGFDHPFTFDHIPDALDGSKS